MSPGESSAKILLVDDDPVILRSYSQRFRGEGWEVTTATDGHDALAAAQTQEWDVILLDLRLPFRSGVEVLKMLRQRRGTTDTPIWVMAQPGDANVVEQAMREGANGVIEKARLGPRDVVNEVERILDARKRGTTVRPLPPTTAVPAAVDEIARRFLKPDTARAPGWSKGPNVRAAADSARAAPSSNAPAPSSQRASQSGLPNTAAPSASAHANFRSPEPLDGTGEYLAVSPPTAEMEPLSPTQAIEAQPAASQGPPIASSADGRSTRAPSIILGAYEFGTGAAQMPPHPAESHDADHVLARLTAVSAPQSVQYSSPAAAAAAAAFDAATAQPLPTFDTMLNRLVGQSAALARALGLPADFACPVCRSQVVLRLSPDPSVENGVRGYFYCGRCSGPQ